MRDIFYFLSYLMFMGLLSCADQTPESITTDMSLEDQMKEETQNWQKYSRQFAQTETLQAFQVDSEELQSILDDKGSNIKLNLALKEDNRVRAYLEGSNSDENVASHKLIIADHVSIGSLLDSRQPVGEIPDLENTIPHEVAASWTNLWTQDGKKWLRNHDLHSFTIPFKSVQGVLSEGSDRINFYMALEMTNEESVIPHLVLTAGGNLKNGGSCYDFIAPCPPVCDD